MSNYSNESISRLKGADRVRLKPGVMLGSDGLGGCQQTFFEILSNALDEYKSGYGDRIEVKLYKDKSLSIRDYGRGVPMDYNDAEGEYNWHLVFNELYAGGKYDPDSGEHEDVLGTNGLGAASTQYASEWFKVTSIRDKTEYSMNFERGNPVGDLSKRAAPAKEKTGTFIHWLPDNTVFTNINITMDYLKTICQKQAIIAKGITIAITDEATNETIEYTYPDGILGYVRELSNDFDKLFTLPVVFAEEGECVDRVDASTQELEKRYKGKFELLFAFSNDLNLIEYYHNSSPLEYGGSPDKALRTSFVTALDREIRRQGKYKNNEARLKFSDIEESLVFVSSTFSTYTSYENQTKKAINNEGIYNFMSEMIKTRFETWFIENQMDANKIVDQILANKRSRETAEKTRVLTKKKLSGNKDNFMNQVKKFVNCKSKDVNKRELYIVEGDSAAGSIKLGRDAEYQALMPIRGKILNCLKASNSKILASEIITDLLSLLGTGMEISLQKNKRPDFDLNKLKWNKIIICTDADVDGFQIRTLLLTMFYKLTPTLLEEGKIYIAETPLYEIEYKPAGKGKKAETFFAFDDVEKNKYLKGKDLARVTIQRSKGLGENQPDMMYATTMNPQTRRLIQVNTKYVEEVNSTFETLLGTDDVARKELIQTEGINYLDKLDLG